MTEVLACIKSTRSLS